MKVGSFSCSVIAPTPPPLPYQFTTTRSLMAGHSTTIRADLCPRFMARLPGPKPPGERAHVGEREEESNIKSRSSLRNLRRGLGYLAGSLKPNTGLQMSAWLQLHHRDAARDALRLLLSANEAWTNRYFVNNILKTIFPSTPSSSAERRPVNCLSGYFKALS